VPQEVGSSTMPHKVNPIHFENAEANLSLANSLFQHFGTHLLYARWQRDLRDSTLLRNLGVALGHSVIAWQNILEGLARIAVDETMFSTELHQHWEVLAEAIQTVLRRFGRPLAYEQLKALTRGHKLDQTHLQTFIQTLDLPEADKQRLLALRPHDYLGYAASLATDLK
jgi:adenylosuccinate lyase